MDLFRHSFRTFVVHASPVQRSISVLKREWVQGLPLEKVYQTIRIGSAKTDGDDHKVLEENMRLVRNENFVGRIRNVEWRMYEAILTLELVVEIPLKVRLPRTF